MEQRRCLPCHSLPSRCKACLLSLRIVLCLQGFKCKFSHDLNVERKGGKMDLFSDK